MIQEEESSQEQEEPGSRDEIKDDFCSERSRHQNIMLSTSKFGAFERADSYIEQPTMREFDSTRKLLQPDESGEHTGMSGRVSFSLSKEIVTADRLAESKWTIHQSANMNTLNQLTTFPQGSIVTSDNSFSRQNDFSDAISKFQGDSFREESQQSPP